MNPHLPRFQAGKRPFTGSLPRPRISINSALLYLVANCRLMEPQRNELSLHPATPPGVAGVSPELGLRVYR